MLCPPLWAPRQPHCSAERAGGAQRVLCSPSILLFHGLRAVLRGLEVQNGSHRAFPSPGGLFQCCQGAAGRKGSGRSWAPQRCRVVSPCLQALALVQGQPFRSQKAELVPGVVASLWPSPGSGTRGWPQCGCPCPAPGDFVPLLLGWIAAAAGMPQAARRLGEPWDALWGQLSPGLVSVSVCVPPRLRKHQMYKASVMKYGELAQGEGLLCGSTRMLLPAPHLCCSHESPRSPLCLQAAGLSPAQCSLSPPRWSQVLTLLGGRCLKRHTGHRHRAAPAEGGQGWGRVVVPSFHQSPLAPLEVPAWALGVTLHGNGASCV